MRHHQGRLVGRMEGLGLKLRAEATLRTLTEEVVKSSEIEGEMLNKEQDGNGRIARAIADQQLARSEKSAQRFYSMFAQIQQERNTYYDILEATQKGDLEITPWLEWFLACLGRAIDGADTILGSVLLKAKFWKSHQGESFSERQRKVLNRMLDGFEGKLTSSKWAALAKCSQDTASRDIDNLLKRNILIKDAAGGRSTSYSLAPTE